MKICHIITTLGYGGAERLLVNVANLHARNHEVNIIYFKNAPELQPMLDPAVRVHQVPLSRSIVRNLRALLARLQPDVVHTHLGHADFVGLIASQGLPVKRYCTMHNIYFKYDWRDQIFFLGYRALFALPARDVHVIAISRSVATHVHRTLGVVERRISVIYNGIPQVQLMSGREELRRELAIPDDAFCVLFVGRLHVLKSVDTLLRAAARLRTRIPNLLVLLVGEGYERERLAALNLELGTYDLVRFCGTTSQPEHYFGVADLFVLPSVCEGFGLVVLEAFRAGVPVVASRIEGLSELIDHGRNGLLFTPRDDEQLADQIARLYTDTVLRQRIGDAGRASFETRFTIEYYARQLDQLYRRGCTEPSVAMRGL